MILLFVLLISYVVGVAVLKSIHNLCFKQTYEKNSVDPCKPLDLLNKSGHRKGLNGIGVVA